MLYNCKGVIFDFNGTLFFDSDKHVMAWGKLAELLTGEKLSLDALQKHFYGVPNNRAIECLLGRKCDEEALSAYSEQKESFYRICCQEDKANFHLVPGAKDFFEQLIRADIPFTIASASIKTNIDFFVKSFQLDTWFDPSRIVYDDGSFENKVSMFQHAAAVIEVPIADCLIFEDSESGIRDAYAAGCRNIVVIDSMGVAGNYQGKNGVKGIIKDFTGLESLTLKQN